MGGKRPKSPFKNDLKITERNLRLLTRQSIAGLTVHYFDHRRWTRIVTHYLSSDGLGDGPSQVRRSVNLSITPYLEGCLTAFAATVKAMLKALGINNILGFDWPASPSAESMIRALEVLYSLGVLDDDEKLEVLYSLGVLDDDTKLTSPAGFKMLKFHCAFSHNGMYKIVRTSQEVYIHPSSVLFSVQIHEMCLTKTSRDASLTVDQKPAWFDLELVLLVVIFPSIYACQSSRKVEGALSQGMEQLQQSLAEMLANGSPATDGSSGDVANYMGQVAMTIGKHDTLDGFLHQALRIPVPTLTPRRDSLSSLRFAPPPAPALDLIPTVTAQSTDACEIIHFGASAPHGFKTRRIRGRCANLVRGAKDQRLRVKEPFQIPTKAQMEEIETQQGSNEQPVDAFSAVMGAEHLRCNSRIIDPNILEALTIHSPSESTFTVAATRRNNQGDRDIEDGSGNEIDELDLT
ncbi:Transcription factor HBP-1b(c38) [Capsicum baccatum]|uniref:Transcription factor HBP-1b(C38) n=1 Tax=Capsicum baccatum TaxID=33114 RepID=A0A2G2VNT8_CAPBA|nr:Transcription factor HBP-1b(c38) [Capsicum baccatum]